MLKFFRNKKGQSATEYMLVLGLMVALIFIVGSQLRKRFPDVVNKAMESVMKGFDSSKEE
jgi:Flp pilus assembly pilin Flp